MASRRGRVLVGLGLVAAALGGLAAANATTLRVQYTAYRFQNAATDDDRAAWADRLAAFGEPGLAKLLAETKAGSVPAARAVHRHLAARPDNDPAAAAIAGKVLAAGGNPAAVLEMLPAVLTRADDAKLPRACEIVTANLSAADPAVRVLAVRAAMHPRVNLRAAIVPLLDAAEPEVRRAAMFAVGPATGGDDVIDDEALFRWLHDPDPGVRAGCHAALGSRGRSEAEIALGGRLAHPDPAERLKLAADLRWDEDDVRDPEPWLERLARDPDPAVRVAAARAAAERKLTNAAWLGHLADADPDPTVRRIAGYYRGLVNPVRPAAGP